MVLYQEYVTDIHEKEFLAFVGQSRKIILGRDINKTDDLKDVVYMGRVGEITQEMPRNVTLSLNLKLIDNEVSAQVVLRLYDTYRFAVVAVGDYVAVTNARFHFKPDNSKFLQTRSISVDEQLTDAVVWVMTTSMPRCARDAKMNYTKLADFRDRMRANFFGVVTTVSPITKTRGTSFMCIIFITDPSISADGDQGKEIRTTIFFDNNIPRIKRGDIIRCLHSKVELFQGRMTVVLHAPPEIVTWSNDNSCIVPCASSESYLLPTEDREELRQLRTWIHKQRCDLLLPPEHEPSLNLMPHYGEFRDAVVGHRMNVVCQMIDLHGLDDTFKVLVVWDGTKPRCPSYQWPTNGILLYNSRISSLIRDYLIFIKIRNEDCEKLLEIKPFRVLYIENVLCLPSENRNDPSIIYSFNTKCNNDSYITVCNASRSQYYMWKFKKIIKTLHPSVCVNWEDDDETVPLKRIRLTSESSKENDPDNYTMIVEKMDCECSGLGHVLETKRKGVYYVRVKIIDYFPDMKTPETAIEMKCTRCNTRSNYPNIKFLKIDEIKCISCNTSGMLEANFAFRFMLHDGKDKLVTLLTDENAELFFRGISPHRCLGLESWRQKITNILQRLCPQKDDYTNWLSCPSPIVRLKINAKVDGSNLAYYICDTVAMKPSDADW